LKHEYFIILQVCWIASIQLSTRSPCNVYNVLHGVCHGTWVRSLLWPTYMVYAVLVVFPLTTTGNQW